MSNLRNQTMNRLNEANFCTPCAPMPAPVIPLSIFEELLYKVAYEYGYTKTKADFSEDFLNSLNGLSSNIIQSGSFSDFPEIGTEGVIYIDSENGEIYYWKDNQYVQINKPQEGPVIPSDGLTYDGGEI